MIRETVPGTDSAVDNSSGSVLKKARLALGLSEQEVASELRLSAYQIRALEAEDYDDLPGTTYVRGYLRAYARLLNLNEDRVITSALTGDAEPGTAVNHEPVPRAQDSPARFPVRAVTGVLLLLLVAVLWLWWYSREGDLASLVESTATLPARHQGSPASVRGYFVAPDAGTLQTADSEKLVSTKRRAVFRFSETSWIDVRDDEGKLLVQRTVAPGLALAVEGDPPFRVFLGNAAAVQVSYAGEPANVTPRQGSLYARFTLGVRPPRQQPGTE